MSRAMASNVSSAGSSDRVRRAGSMLLTTAALPTGRSDEPPREAPSTAAADAAGASSLAIDIVCLGKGLGGGLPISACIGPEPIMRAWAREPPVVHTSTHAGLPLACAAAVATLDTLRFRKLPERAREVGARAKEFLAALLTGRPGVVEVRGEGLMIGIELDGPERATQLIRSMLARGYLVLGGGSRGETLTLTPALTIEAELLDGGARAFADCLGSP